ncbi:MAG: M23 family metallopeptidase [Anaerolineales bacterium]|nr:M23 family metallopeptidase [Anaerolineales bacterium]
MTNNVSQIPSTYNLSGMTAQPNAAESSSNDMLSSFKEILSTMMMTSGGLSSGQQNSSGLSDLMAPLMMITLLEKLVEGLVEQETPAGTVQQKDLFNQGSKVEPSGRPVGGVLTQNYHPGHNGLDFGIPVGTPIESTMDGKVVHAGWNNQGYGNLVIVENGGYRTYYAHLSSIPVSVGDTVRAGTTIGLSGNTGNSTGPHLHYEIRKNNIPVDPTSTTLGSFV